MHLVVILFDRVKKGLLALLGRDWRPRLSPSLLISSRAAAPFCLGATSQLTLEYQPNTTAPLLHLSHLAPSYPLPPAPAPTPPSRRRRRRRSSLELAASPMAFSAQPHAAPIKLEGFDIPGTSTGPNSNGFSVDPTHLYGAVGGFGSQQGRAGYYGGSGAGFSELDLDFETTLASLAQHGQHGANPYNPSSSHQHSHSFGGGGGGAGGSLGLGGQGAGANGYLGTSNANFEQFGYHRIDKQQPQQQPPPPPLAPTSTTANNYPGLPPFLTSSAPRQSPSIPAFTAAPSPHHHDSRSPTAILSPQAMDMFGNVCSPAPAPLADSPANEFGSYSSVGDAFSQPQLSTSSSTSNSATKKGSAARGRSPPDHSQPPTERGRAAGRSTSKSSQAGKAPTSRVRSRSARRNATGVAYQAMGTGGAAQQATAAASSSTAAIVIPGASGSAAAANHHHPLAMSMPAYGTNGATGTGGLPSASWFASGQALGLGGAAVGEGQHATDETDLTGWRPSAEQKGPGLVPASAPTLGAAKKGKAALDDVPEDATSKQ